jgi:hypothetical protein
MATDRMPMHKLREILRLKWVAQRSHREVARSVGVSPGAVASVLTRARAHALTWAQIETLTEDALERQLYGPRASDVEGRRPEPDLAWMHQERVRPVYSHSHEWNCHLLQKNGPTVAVRQNHSSR